MGHSVCAYVVEAYRGRSEQPVLITGLVAKVGITQPIVQFTANNGGAYGARLNSPKGVTPQKLSAGNLQIDLSAILRAYCGDAARDEKGTCARPQQLFLSQVSFCNDESARASVGGAVSQRRVSVIY